MRFLVALNDDEGDTSTTFDVINTGSDNARFNKRILRSYFEQKGVPKPHIKRVMKAMGFWGDRLGV
mgnify:CR=1 FL=1